MLFYLFKKQLNSKFLRHSESFGDRPHTLENAGESVNKPKKLDYKLTEEEENLWEDRADTMGRQTAEFDRRHEQQFAELDAGYDDELDQAYASDIPDQPAINTAENGENTENDTWVDKLKIWVGTNPKEVRADRAATRALIEKAMNEAQNSGIAEGFAGSGVINSVGAAAKAGPKVLNWISQKLGLKKTPKTKSKEITSFAEEGIDKGLKGSPKLANTELAYGYRRIMPQLEKMRLRSGEILRNPETAETEIKNARAILDNVLELVEEVVKNPNATKWKMSQKRVIEHANGIKEEAIKGVMAFIREAKKTNPEAANQHLFAIKDRLIKLKQLKIPVK